MTQPLVLVTGIEGFTGPRLRASLTAAGYRVVGTSLRDAATGDFVLDIESPAACKEVIGGLAPDFVIHLAGISFVPSDPVRTYAANVVGTVNVLDALVSAPNRPTKIVLASSANVYGNRDALPLSEGEEPRPANHYAVSKLAMEKMAANYFDRLPIIITRPFNYTGIGQSVDFLIPKIVSHFVRRAPRIELGNLDIERDFSDVDTVVDVYTRLLASSCRSTVLNICSGEPTSIAAVVETLESLAGYRIDVQTSAQLVRSNDVRRLVGDPTLLQAAIGSVHGIPFRATLRKMYEAMLDHEPAS